MKMSSKKVIHLFFLSYFSNQLRVQSFYYVQNLV